MKRIVSIVLFVAVAACAVWAADFWETKKYTEWSERDIEKMLRNSPWAKVTMVPMEVGPDMRTNAPSATAAQASQGGGLGQGNVDNVNIGRRDVAIVVRFQTALPVRQALVAQQIKAGKITGEQADKALAAPQQHYVVMVAGIPMNALKGVTPEMIKEASSLKPGKAEPIAADEVRVGQGPEPTIYLLFPRTREIIEADKDVEFTSKFKNFEVRKKFGLKDMVVGGKLTL